MGNIILGIGDLGVSSEKDAYIKTYALGSCVAIIFYDRIAHLGAMAHVALPESNVDRAKGKKKPGYFADTAVPYLLNKIKEKNPLTNIKNLHIRLAGGASVMDKTNFFNIGGRNLQSARQILKEHGLFVDKEDVGSTISRTVTLDINTGSVLLFNPAKGVWEI